MKRRDVNATQEKYVLEKFTQYLKNQKKTLKIYHRPDPPDAIVSIDGNKTWIEITSSWLDNNLAKTMTASISEDILKKMQDARQLMEKSLTYTVEEKSIKKLLDDILKKYNKKSIKNVYKEQGSGILIVSIINPFFTAKELSQRIIEPLKKELQNKPNEKIFSIIYLMSALDMSNVDDLGCFYEVCM